MTTLIQVSENCFKHKDKNDNVFYRETADLESEYHRQDGPAIEFASGTKEWIINGKHHRENGPAIEFANGNKAWYINGKLHRKDGPALEYANGKKYWYCHGVLIYVSSQEEFEKHIDINSL